MLWKVPDPEMRKRLRKAITEKIISGYTKYIEDNNVITLRSTTHNLEEMLQELFEG
jgi:DNA-binding Lrp family transcriptional regulator